MFFLSFSDLLLASNGWACTSHVISRLHKVVCNELAQLGDSSQQRAEIEQQIEQT